VDFAKKFTYKLPNAREGKSSVGESKMAKKKAKKAKAAAKPAVK
jgi:hypothetical protein